MDKYRETQSLRIYTGSGYEDFIVGEKVSGAHIVPDRKTKTVKTIVIYENDTIFVDFNEGGETYCYKGLAYRYSQF
jgi:hypothetical protein